MSNWRGNMLSEVKEVVVVCGVMLCILLGCVLIQYMDSAPIVKERVWTKEELDAMKDFEVEFNRMGIVPGMTNYEYFQKVESGSIPLLE